MRTVIIALALGAVSIVFSCTTAYAVSFNCFPYFKTGPPSPAVISNVTQIPNSTQEEWWLVDCKAIPITVTTNKLSYESGDTVITTGTVSQIPQGVAVAVKVVSPDGNIVRIDQAPVSSNGTFTSKFVTGGNLWQKAGVYTLEVQEVNTMQSASAKFYFSGPPAVPYISSILVNNTNITVPYTIVNGKVNSITVDKYMRSLVISLQSTGRGALTIDLPRTHIDSKGANQTDLDFVVTSDSKVPPFDETRGPTTRDLVIPFENDTKQIRIIGTQVVPEFGAVSVALLAVLLLGAVAIAKVGSPKMYFRRT